MHKKKLLQYLEFKGLTKYKFYKKTGISNGFLDDGGTFGVDKLEVIASCYPDLNMDWLMFEQGEMIKEEGKSYVQKRKELKLNQVQQDVPVYDAGTRLGNVTVYTDEIDKERPLGTLSAQLFPGCDHAEKVAGDSMYPLIINQGIIVGKIVDKQGIIWGEKYGVHTMYGLRVAKFIHPHTEDGKVKLVSYNKSIPEQVISLNDINFCFRILYIINPA